MAIRIETADLSDADQARALEEILDSYAQGPGGQNAPLSAEARDKLAAGLSAHANAFVLLGYEEQRAVGAAVCFVGFSTFAGKPNVNIHDLAVLPDFRGRGIGTALMNEVERIARSRDCCKITLEVLDNNDGAKKLYRAQGFGPWEAATLFVSKPL